ncbi:MAG TPA: hypothetical protein VF974_07865 [Patescibacteria group bacterium]
MRGFLLALLVGAFVFGNMVRLLNPRLPVRKDPVDNWDLLYAFIYWPVYTGVLFPSLSAGLLYLLSGNLEPAGRSALRMIAGLFIWNPVQFGKQGLTFVCWLLWGSWMLRSASIEPQVFWPLFMVGTVLWLFLGPAILWLLIFGVCQVRSGHQLKLG